MAMVSELLRKLDEEKNATIHWSLTAEDQMQLCEDMFTGLGFLETFSIAPETLRQFLRSIKAQYKGVVSTANGNAGSARIFP
eukprot:COSAG02_NODE_12493_length_1537_cov_1.769124_1_plen_82_part_00